MSKKTHWPVAGVAALAFGVTSLALSGQSFAAPPHTNQPSTTQSVQTLTKSQIESVQAALQKAGYQVKVDGVLGSNTTNALKMFQTKNGLPATGYPDQQTRQALGLSW